MVLYEYWSNVGVIFCLYVFCHLMLTESEETLIHFVKHSVRKKICGYFHFSRDNIDKSALNTVVKNIETDVKDAVDHIKDGVKETKHFLHELLEPLLKYVPAFVANGIEGVLKKTIFMQFKELMKYLSSHPILALPLFAVTLFIGLPLLTFSIFAVISTISTFVGFLVVEGTLVGVGALMMIGCVLAVFGLVFLILFGISVAVFLLQKINIL